MKWKVMNQKAIVKCENGKLLYSLVHCLIFNECGMYQLLLFTRFQNTSVTGISTKQSFITRIQFSLRQRILHVHTLIVNKLIVNLQLQYCSWQPFA